MEKIKITYNSKVFEVSPLTTPLEFFEQHSALAKAQRPVAAILNGHPAQLSKKMQTDTILNVIELKTYQGQRIYESSLMFLFLVAFKKLFPTLSVFIQHSIQQGIYAEVKERKLTDDEVDSIRTFMDALVAEKQDIKAYTKEWDVALSHMRDIDRSDLANLYRNSFTTDLKVYELAGVEESLYLPLVPNTSYLSKFALQNYQDGVAILMPDFEKGKEISDFKHNIKLFQTYKEFNDWSRVLKVRTVGQLNEYLMVGEISNYIKIAEAFQEKKVANIADQITRREFIPRLILIAGPSSSGKTTFSKRLDIQLRVSGYRPVAISLDDYFIDREKTPRDEKGEYDFECLEAINYTLFQQHLADLLAGKKIELPKFDFVSGKSSNSGHFLQLADDQLIIVEGIHGLNPHLTEIIEDRHKFKIYISALTQLNLHRHDRIPTSDTRLIRRIVRDSNFRGHSASATLKQWQSVRAGEGKNIYPHQESADVIFNSALFYELSVLKVHAERELLRVEPLHPMYAEARRLLKFLSFFLPLDAKDVPNNSILKEFIGGSSFRY